MGDTSLIEEIPDSCMNIFIVTAPSIFWSSLSFLSCWVCEEVKRMTQLTMTREVVTEMISCFHIWQGSSVLHSRSFFCLVEQQGDSNWTLRGGTMSSEKNFIVYKLRFIIIRYLVGIKLEKEDKKNNNRNSSSRLRCLLIADWPQAKNTTYNMDLWYAIGLRSVLGILTGFTSEAIRWAQCTKSHWRQYVWVY